MGRAGMGRRGNGRGSQRRDAENERACEGCAETAHAAVSRQNGGAGDCVVRAPLSGKA